MSPISVSVRIARERFAAWLASTNATRLRLVCAPLATGKTSALAALAEQRPAEYTFSRVPVGAGAGFVHDLAAAQGATTVILDDADHLGADGVAAIVEGAGGSGRRFVLVARSRITIGAHALLARGLAIRCDPAVLAFDRREIAHLARAYGVAHDDADVEAVAYESEGWPLAAEWIVRDAAEEGRSLRDAPAQWRARNGHLLLEFLNGERWAPQRETDAFFGLLAGGWATAQPELERLEALGFPLVRTAHGVRPYRVLARLAAVKRDIDDRMSMRLAPPMMVSLLGRFRCEVAGRAVQFARRRDQQLFAYVALADAGVSRKTLLAEFWAGTEPQVAAQSLRTALSRIRRAVADAAAGGEPGRYFNAEGDVRIERGAVVVDARRFVEHLAAGRLAEARGDAASAIAHYRNAYRVYAGSLLESEGTEPCLARRAAAFEAQRREVLERLAALYTALGEHDVADRFAGELRSCGSAATA